MKVRTIVLAVGAAITTFLLVGATTIELLGAGEAPGIGIIGVFVGFLTGLLAGAAVGAFATRLSGLAATALVGYAAFGITFMLIAGLRYVNVPGADDVFTFPVHVGISIVVAALLALSVGRRGLREQPSDA